MLFALDDAAEGKDWDSVQTGMDNVAQVLTTALGMLRNDVALVGQV